MGSESKETPPEWRELVSEDDWEFLEQTLGTERLGDLFAVLSECPPEARSELLAGVRSAAGFRDRAVTVGLARLLHDLEQPPAGEPDR